jgi:hypothetical protein
VGPTNALADMPIRFKLVNAVPATLFVGIIGMLLLSGAPRRAPSFDVLLERARHYGWVGAAAAAGVVAVGALLLEPLELASIRLLEGYWSPWGPLGKLADLGCWLQERRQERLLFLYDVAGSGSETAARVQRQLAAFPEGGPLLPTALGNRLRAFEERAGAAYSVQAIHLWPRLYHVLPDSALATVNEFRNQLDTASRLCLSLGMTALIAAGLLARQPLWWMLPVVLLLASVAAYRSALAAADNYGVAVATAIDVYRLRLLQEMRLQMPVDTEEERQINDQLRQLWAGSRVASVAYALTDGDTGTSSKSRRDRGGRPLRRRGRRSL